MPLDPIMNLVEPARSNQWPMDLAEPAAVRRIARRRRTSRAVALAGCLAVGLVITATGLLPSLQNRPPEISATSQTAELKLASGVVISVPDGWEARPEGAASDTETICLLLPGSEVGRCPIEIRSPLPGAELSDASQPAQVAVEGCSEDEDARPVDVEHFQVAAGDAGHFTGRCNASDPVTSVWALDDRSVVLKVTEARWDSVAHDVLLSATGGADGSPTDVPPSVAPEENR